MTRAGRENRNAAGLAEDEDHPAPAHEDRRGSEGEERSAPPGADDAFPDPIAMRQDRKRQLQYVREFFNNPLLMDLRSAPITTGSDPAEIEQRKKDLAYRIDVLDALRTLMADELAEIERIGKSGE